MKCHAVFRRPLLLASVSLCLLGCTRGAPSDGERAAPSRSDGERAAAGNDEERAELSAQRALARLDTRADLPLLPAMAQHQKENMRDHLQAVQEIVEALGQRDFSGVERAASRIGYSEAMGRTCTHMGAGAPGFTEQALHFHHTADTIGAAAKSADDGAVLRALGATLHACNGCHAGFKQRIVDDATWQRLASAPSAAGHR